MQRKVFPTVGVSNSHYCFIINTLCVNHKLFAVFNTIRMFYVFFQRGMHVSHQNVPIWKAASFFFLHVSKKKGTENIKCVMYADKHL